MAVAAQSRVRLRTGAGDLVDRPPGVLQAHGRLEREEIIVARIVKVEGALLQGWHN